MPPELDPEEDYLSEEDSDFAPEDAPAEDSSASDDEEKAAEAPSESSKKRKRNNADDNDADNAGYENSGDEAIIEKGKKRQRKKRSKPKHDGAEDVDGDADQIKTRSMRAVEKADRRAATISNGPVTVDVDALWAQMTSAPVVPSAATTTNTIAAPPGDAQPTSTIPTSTRLGSMTTKQSVDDPPDQIRIKRTYNFAGKVHTEEKLVARDSAEAKLYLASLSDQPDADLSPPRRLPRKAFRSVFEPVLPPAELVPMPGAERRGRKKRVDLDLALASRLRARELAAAGVDAKKLNTVEKSRMDWAGYVDKEGIKDELEMAGRSKHSYAARQDFLARSEAIREEEVRRLRVAGRT